MTSKTLAELRAEMGRLESEVSRAAKLAQDARKYHEQIYARWLESKDAYLEALEALNKQHNDGGK